MIYRMPFVSVFLAGALTSQVIPTAVQAYEDGDYLTAALQTLLLAMSFWLVGEIIYTQVIWDPRRGATYQLQEDARQHDVMELARRYEVTNLYQYSAMKPWRFPDDYGSVLRSCDLQAPHTPHLWTLAPSYTAPHICTGD